MPDAPPPEVYAFTDGTAWLRAWFAWWQAQAASRTLGTLARRVGCAKSTLSLALSGKRHPAREALLKYNVALCLDLERIEFLCLLFDRDRARSHEERTAFVAAIERRRREHDARSKRPVEAAYLGAWENLVLREIARCMSLPADPDRLLALFPPYLAMDPERLARSLAWLRAHGLLVPDGDGMLRADRDAVETAPVLDGGKEIHLRALEQAGRSIGGVPHEARDLGILTIGLREEDVAMIKAEIWRLLQRLRDLSDASTPPTVVYQFTTQLLPMFEPKRA